MFLQVLSLFKSHIWQNRKAKWSAIGHPVPAKEWSKPRRGGSHSQNKGMEGRNSWSSFYQERPFHLFGWSPACLLESVVGRDCGRSWVLSWWGLEAESPLKPLAWALHTVEVQQMLFEEESDEAARWNGCWDSFLATILDTHALFLGPALLLSSAPASRRNQSDLLKIQDFSCHFLLQVTQQLHRALGKEFNSLARH